MMLVGYFGLRQAHLDLAAKAFIDEYTPDFETSRCMRTESSPVARPLT